MKVQTTLLALSSLLSLVSAFPAVKRDSSINEPAVAAPNGTPVTLTGGAAPTAPPAGPPAGVDNSNSCSSGDCGAKPPMEEGCMGGDCASKPSESSCGGGDCQQSSSSAWESSSTSMMAESTSSSSVWEYTSTATAEASSTWSSSSAAPTYGSGYTPPSGYDGCVQQCMASYAPPPSMVTATPSYPPDYNNNAQGSGATHTVWVAPTQGVLRYVPFAVNASVGDTVRFIWGGGPHTVTKGSQFNLCNSTKEAPFASGKQNKSFTFDQVVNDTKPTFYYCAVAEHCKKGMFGIINPPNAQPGSQDTVQIMSQVMAQNNSDVAAQWSYMSKTCSNNTVAANWGSNIDMSAITTDPEGQLALAQNTMYTRIAMAMNEKSITPDGGFNPDVSAAFAVPMDISKVTASSNPSDSSSTPPAGGSNNAGDSPSGTSDASSSAPTTSTGGASRRVASSATAVFAAIAIAAFAL